MAAPGRVAGHPEPLCYITYGKNQLASRTTACVLRSTVAYKGGSRSYSMLNVPGSEPFFSKIRDLDDAKAQFNAARINNLNDAQTVAVKFLRTIVESILVTQTTLSIRAATNEAPGDASFICDTSVNTAIQAILAFHTYGNVPNNPDTSIILAINFVIEVTPRITVLAHVYNSYDLGNPVNRKSVKFSLFYQWPFRYMRGSDADSSMPETLFGQWSFPPSEDHWDLQLADSPPGPVTLALAQPPSDAPQQPLRPATAAQPGHPMEPLTSLRPARDPAEAACVNRHCTVHGENAQERLQNNNTTSAGYGRGMRTMRNVMNATHISPGARVFLPLHSPPVEPRPPPPAYSPNEGRARQGPPPAYEEPAIVAGPLNGPVETPFEELRDEGQRPNCSCM